jgi:F420-dependent methylenetetrahydromethanopterin dehydrogenase
MELLNEKATLKQVIAAVNALIEAQKSPIARDRGPKSTRDMTEDDAKRIMIGDLKGKSHKECCEALGLSYGQIYSARNGYTFKVIYKLANTKVV